MTKSRKAPQRRPWGALLAAAAGVGLVWVAVLQVDVGRRHQHPAPREGVTAAHVMHTSAVAPRYGALAAEAYLVAARMPAVLDGVRCLCNCQANFGHYSLLSCFEELHGAGCQICQDEALLAADVTGGGASLQDVRDAIDRRWGS